MKRSNKDISEWAETAHKEALKYAKIESQKRMNKDIEECSDQVRLKIMASANRMIYE